LINKLAQSNYLILFHKQQAQYKYLAMSQTFKLIIKQIFVAGTDGTKLFNDEKCSKTWSLPLLPSLNLE
jgi:hypothetical protein